MHAGARPVPEEQLSRPPRDRRRMATSPFTSKKKALKSTLHYWFEWNLRAFTLPPYKSTHLSIGKRPTIVTARSIKYLRFLLLNPHCI
jgi:hypothetical protein